MEAATGTIIDGKIVVEGLSLPEGTTVTVVARVGNEPIRLPEHLQRELDEAIAEADREDGGAGQEFLETLKRFG